MTPNEKTFRIGVLDDDNDDYRSQPEYYYDTHPLTREWVEHMASECECGCGFPILFEFIRSYALRDPNMPWGWNGMYSPQTRGCSFILNHPESDCCGNCPDGMTVYKLETEDDYDTFGRLQYLVLDVALDNSGQEFTPELFESTWDTEWDDDYFPENETYYGIRGLFAAA